MDSKILAGAIAISLLAFVGIAFALPNWHRDGNWTLPGSNETGNFTRPPGPGFGWGEFGRNKTMNWTGPKFNSTPAEQFNQAIASGDYGTAKQLHDEYGFGGPLFNKLNETTFATYSQIYNLQAELGKELGIGGQPPMGPRFGGIDAGYGFGGFGLAHGKRRG